MSASGAVATRALFKVLNVLCVS